MTARLLKRSEFFPGVAHSVAVEPRQPQNIFPQHCHDFDEIVIVFSGNGLHIWNGVLYQVTYGDLIYITQKDVHCFQSAEHLELYNILFCRDRLRLMTDWQSLIPDPDSEQESRRWRLSSEGIAAIKTQIHNLQQESQKRDLLSIKLSEVRFLELTLLLTRYRHSPAAPVAEDYVDIDNVLTLMNAGLSKKIELEKMCEHNNFSSRSIRDLFKQLTGMTMSRYQLMCRLYHAINLINTSRLAISDIALQCGFNDSNYFSVLFQRTFKRTPSYFRRTLLSGTTTPDDHPLIKLIISAGGK